MNTLVDAPGNRMPGAPDLEASRLRAEIGAYEEMVDCIRFDTDNPDDLVALKIFNALVQERHALLVRLPSQELEKAQAA
jgi:hypothetical protein